VRESKVTSDSDAFADGQEAGRAWAIRKAEPDELQRLHDAASQFGTSAWSITFGWDATATYGPDERLFFLFHPEQDGDRRESQVFWARALGDRWTSQVQREHFLSGFADGALEAWNESNDKS
jgi:hypothetical protein